MRIRTLIGILAMLLLPIGVAACGAPASTGPARPAGSTGTARSTDAGPSDSSAGDSGAASSASAGGSGTVAGSATGPQSTAPTPTALSTAPAGGTPGSIAAAPSGGLVSSPESTSSQVTVSGVIIEGLRPSCRVLQTPARRYALTGPGTAALKEGDRITVTGRPRPELISPCGSVFVVTAIG